MTLMPMATFLAGSLLTILLPISLLIGLVVWYAMFLRRASEPADTSDLGRSGAEASGTSAGARPAEGAGPAAGPQPPGGR